jgi:acetyl esterase/lipase
MSQSAGAPRVAMGGDSAGGGLALTTLQEAARFGMPRAACAILLTAWADMRCAGASYDTNAARDPVANREMAQMMASGYLGANGSALDPRATPMLGSAHGLPPMMIQAAGRDVFLDDSRAIADWARAGGVDVALDVWDDMIHQWQQYASVLPEARRALAALGAFVRERMDAAGA